MKILVMESPPAILPSLIEIVSSAPCSEINYGMNVPEVGLLFIFTMNTTFTCCHHS
jgi:hypothetical protein